MSANRKIGIGIIGAGRRGIFCLGSRIAESTKETGFEVRAVCDVNPTRMNEAAGYLTRKFSESGISLKISQHSQYQNLIDDPAVELIMVTTPSYAHRDPTILALRSGKKVYLDKPIAQNIEDSIAIMEEEMQTGNSLIMGFTRRYETPWRKAFSHVQQGVIGDLHMIQIRAIIPYDVYGHTWRRRRKWSGGALNDKASHHFDAINWFAQSSAKHISAIGGQAVYKPDPTAPERCSECSRECNYRMEAKPSRNLTQQYQDVLPMEGDSWSQETQEIYRIDNCVYLPGSDIKDHAIVQVAYDNGVVASLFWSIFGPHADDQETLELVGSNGRIILKRHTAELDIVSHYGEFHEVINYKDDAFETSHFGADLKLIRDMRSFFDGESPIVSAQHGFESTRMVMATHQSIDNVGQTVLMKDIPSTNR
ncbi:MAG: Gfo/Idh/MocA family oxidoreductase [Phycisphaeraceae bacterium]|nr:Gfo/Idh/MocA family oxidoreductase [Phycisphaeraceae bacterium]